MPQDIVDITKDTIKAPQDTIKLLTAIIAQSEEIISKLKDSAVINFKT